MHTSILTRTPSSRFIRCIRPCRNEADLEIRLEALYRNVSCGAYRNIHSLGAPVEDKLVDIRSLYKTNLSQERFIMKK